MNLYPIPLVDYNPKKDRWTLLEEFKDPVSGSVIPKGFSCDLASIPESFWCILPPYSLSVAAPIVHDWLYKTCGNLKQRASRDLPPYTKSSCDKFFNEIMKIECVPYWKRRVSYLAVKFFGGSAWEKYQREFQQKSTLESLGTSDQCLSGTKESVKSSEIADPCS